VRVTTLNASFENLKGTQTTKVPARTCRGEFLNSILDQAPGNRWHTDCIIERMPDYRIYFFKDGRLAAPAKVIVRPSDEAAIEDAKKLVDGHDTEVWQGAAPLPG
jgi:hypothetical protein